MRILILSQNYIPEPDPKMHILGAGLVKGGHKVTVLTGFPNYPQGKIYPGYRQKLWQCEYLDGVKIVRVPLYPDRSKSIIKRSWNYLSFPLVASILGNFLREKIDIILVYHPPITLGLPAYILSRLRKAPFVFEIQDMWPETLPATGMVSNRFLLGMLQKFSMAVYSQAAKIIVISPGFKKNLESKGVPSEKIAIFYNWAYEGVFPLVSPDNGLAQKLGLAGRFNILYAGNLGPAQGLSNIIEAASLLTDIDELQFVLVGSGTERGQLEKMIDERGIKNVKILPRQPMEMMPSLYAVVDAVMVHLTDDPLFEITIPGKTQSCLLSGRPIIVSVNGDAQDLVARAGAGWGVRAMEPRELADAARRLYGLPQAAREAMGSAGRKYYLENLSPEVQIPRYEKLFTDIINANKGEKAKWPRSW